MMAATAHQITVVIKVQTDIRKAGYTKTLLLFSPCQYRVSTPLLGLQYRHTAKRRYVYFNMLFPSRFRFSRRSQSRMTNLIVRTCRMAENILSIISLLEILPIGFVWGKLVKRLVRREVREDKKTINFPYAKACPYYPFNGGCLQYENIVKAA